VCVCVRVSSFAFLVMRFYCHCLNVNIDVLETNDDQETLTQFIPADLVQFVNISHEWLLCDAPKDQSVQIIWQSLIQIHPIREMKLYRCLGCHLYTHVTNIGSSQMLVNKDLIPEDKVQEIYHDPNYSKIAKIILPTVLNSVNSGRFSGLQGEFIQTEVDTAQQLYRDSIQDLEQETEERIRIFQREQEQLLEAKTETLKKELDIFLNLMRSSRQTTNAKTSPTLQSSSSYINENSTESGFGSDIFDVNSNDFIRQSSNFERTFSDRTANLDDEANDDPMLDNRNWYNENTNPSNFATSLPKTISFRPTKAFDVPQQLIDDDIDDLERIGKSFRDLSRSMCTDGTELFGDLPSPRLNYRHT